MNTDSPDTILFDLDGTLCEPEQSGSKALETAFERLDLDPLFEMGAFHDRYIEYLSECEDPIELFERTFGSLVADRGGDRTLGRPLAETYFDVRDPTDVRPIEGASGVVSALAEQYRLGIITNGNPTLQRGKLEALPFTDAFETIVYAGSECPPKPDPTSFDRALADIDGTPERTIYVGNKHETDVAGAHRAGIRSVLLDMEGAKSQLEPEPTFVISSLSSLAEGETQPW